MLKEIFFCHLQALKDKKKITIWNENLKDEISAFYVNEEIYVYSSICPHFGGEFEYNKKKLVIRCLWHGWKFDVTTGKSISDINHYKKNSFIHKILHKNEKKPLGCFSYDGQLTKYDYKAKDGNLYIVYEDS